MTPPADASADTVETADTSDTATDDCDEFAAAQCAYGARCGTRWFHELQYASDAECRAYQTKRCRSSPPLKGTTTTYRTDCIAALRDGECSAAAVCDKGGTLPDGQSCMSAAQCASGHCRPAETCGVCAPAAATGDSCSASVICGNFNLVCDVDTGKCVDKTPIGGACDTFGECGVDASCRGGFCVKHAGDGEPCGGSMDSHPDCGSGLTCVGGTCAKTVVVGVGDTCDAARLCRGRCVSGKCVAKSPIGGACTATSDCGWWARCREGACELGLGTWECPG